MALLSIRQVSDDITLGLWKIEETPEIFFRNCSYLEKYRTVLSDLYKSDKRLCEVLAVRTLLYSIFGTDIELSHETNGCPHLSKNMNIGISHTNGYAAVIISKRYRVSVDIERISNRVSRVTDKFLRPDEKADTIIEQLLHWCTKETVYKLYPEDDLKFEEMKVSAIDGSETEGIIKAENIKRKEVVNVSYGVSADYVLTYSFY